MSNKSGNEFNQSGDTNSPVASQGLAVGQLSILLVQGFAIFAAFSTLLGRIYFLAYSDTLKIPESEFDLDVLSYSVISPDVVISGFGVAVSSVVIVLSFRWRINPSYRWILFAAGIGLLGTVLYTVMRDLSGDDIPEPGAGAFGIWWLIFIVGWTSGTALIYSFLVSWFSSDPICTTRSQKGSRSARTSQGWMNSKLIQEGSRLISLASLFAGGIATIVLLLLMTILQATAVGTADASLQLRDAPLVEITANSSDSSSILIDEADNSESASSTRKFKLVHVGEKFVYIRLPELSCVCPRELGLLSGEPYQYAIPIANIVSITQIAQPN